MMLYAFNEYARDQFTPSMQSKLKVNIQGEVDYLIENT